MTRKSKIARLPRPIRDELNHRLDNGEPGIRLAEWLNSLPEVQEILAREFEGRRITPQNLSEWKSGGYQDWLAHQEQQATLRDFLADAKELGEAASPEKLTEAMFTFVTVHYAAAMYECTYRPENRDKLNLWSPILNDVIRLRNSDLAQQRFELDTQRLELQTEVARHRLELDLARLDLARQKAGLREQSQSAAARLDSPERGCVGSEGTSRSTSNNQTGIAPSDASTTSPSPPRNRGLEPLGKRRKECGRSHRPARAERAGASESLGQGEEVLRAHGETSFDVRCSVFDVRCSHPQEAEMPPKSPLIIKHLQPNPTKSNNPFFIFLPPVTVGHPALSELPIMSRDGICRRDSELTSRNTACPPSRPP